MFLLELIPTQGDYHISGTVELIACMGSSPLRAGIAIPK